MIEASSVFEYTDYRNFVSTFLKEKKRQNKNFSMRLWTSKLGLKSPSALSMVLSGQRHPGEEFTDELVNFFRFTSHQAKYFRLLVKLAKVNGDEKKRIKILTELEKTNPRRNFHLLEADIFEAVSNWYFFVIREMVQLKDFKENGSWISGKLNKAITPKEVKRAISIMLRLGLLKREKNNQLIQTNHQITTSADVPSEVLKQFHEEMILLGQQSIRKIPLKQREVTSVTLNMNPEKMIQAKELIREFRIKFTELIEENPGTETYQFNIQFFPLTNLNQEEGGRK